MALRYFGSKAWFKEKLDELVPEDAETLVSPFLGSGKAELHLAKRRPELTILGSDLFKPVVNFHQRLRDGSLVESLQKWVGASLDKDDYRKLLADIEDAANFFMVMRHSFHGKFGTYSKAGKLTKRTTDILARMQMPNFIVEQRDALDAIRNAPPRSVIFADPPYLFRRRGKYYAQSRGDLEFQKALAEALKARGLPFVLCTNDEPEVLKLYEGCRIQAYPRTCRTSKTQIKRYNEIVVTQGL
jgi:site-specific DNA-adenine methylase